MAPRRTLSRWVLGSLIRQLADNYHPLPRQVLEMFKKKGGPASKSREMSMSQYLELLKCMVPSDTVTILILDALDECVRTDNKTDSRDRKSQVHEVETLLDVFGKLLGSNQVKIVVSSQENETINAHLGPQNSTGPSAQITGAKVLGLVVSATDNTTDILKLVRTRIREKESKEGQARRVPLVSAELEEEIIKVFAEKSGGMFQWANYHIQYLLSLDSGPDIKEALPGLPEELEKAYEETFKRIDNDKTPRKRVASRVTQWLLANDGSCKKGVILAAISQSLEDKPTEELNYDERVVIKACCNLVAMEGDVFRFSHLSIQEYCVNHRDEGSDCHSHVAKMCLWMMSNYDSSVIDSADESSAETTLLDLWNYAYQNWYRQFGLSTKYQQEGLKKLLESFIGDGHPAIGCTHWLVRLATDAIRSGRSLLSTTVLEFVVGPEAWTSMARRPRDQEFGHLQQLLRALIAGLLSKVRHIFLQYLQHGKWPSEGKEINRLVLEIPRHDHVPKRRQRSEQDSSLDGVKNPHLLQIRDLWILARLLLNAPDRCWEPPSLFNTHYSTERADYLRHISDIIFAQSSTEQRNKMLEKLVPNNQWESSKTNIAQCHDELARLSLLLLATRRKKSPSLDWELEVDILAFMAHGRSHEREGRAPPHGSQQTPVVRLASTAA